MHIVASSAKMLSTFAALALPFLGHAAPAAAPQFQEDVQTQTNVHLHMLGDRSFTNVNGTATRKCELALRYFIDSGTNSVPLLLRVLNSRPPKERCQAVFALHRIAVESERPEAMFPWTKPCAIDSSMDVRIEYYAAVAATRKALLKKHNRAQVAVGTRLLKQGLVDREREVRLVAATLLMDAGRTAEVPTELQEEINRLGLLP